MSDTCESLDQTETELNAERQRGQQIQDQLRRADKATERLQGELKHVRRATQRKVIGFSAQGPFPSPPL